MIVDAFHSEAARLARNVHRRAQVTLTMSAYIHHFALSRIRRGLLPATGAVMRSKRAKVFIQRLTVLASD